MAPILLEAESPNSHPIVAPVKASPSKPSKTAVDLALQARPLQLLRLVEALDAPSVVKDEHPDTQIQRMIQLAWIITIRAFASSATFYIAEQYQQGRSFVGETSPAHAGSAAQIHVDPQETVQDLFAQKVSNLAQVSGPSQTTNGDAAQYGKDVDYNATLSYQRMPAKRMSSDLKLCVGRCQVCCSQGMAIPVEPEPTPPKHEFNGLHLEICYTPDDRLHARLDLSRSSVEMELALSLLHSFNQALSSVDGSSVQSIKGVELCAPHDRDRIAQFTRVVAPAQNSLLHDLCLRHAATTPDAPAIRSWDGDLTYRELNDLASRLAHWLASHGVKPGFFVACAFYKSTWTIVARLAILMAGGAYICVDAKDPPSYLQSALERTKIQIILTSVGYADNFAKLVGTQFEVSKESLQALPSLPGVPCANVLPTDPCTVLFTSGSTGKPKGIVQEHRSYASALTDYIRVFGMGSHTRMFQFDAYAFDISNNDFLSTLIAGGCCCVPTTSLSMDALMGDLNTLQANMMFVTPSVAIDMDPALVPTLQVMCIGGEPVSDAVLAKWLDHVKVFNQYGMGEVASLCCYNNNLQMGRGAVVGRPASGAIWIVNPDLPDQLMPIGAVGEVLVEGPHISRGYLDHVSGKSENFLTTSPAWMTQLHPERPQHKFYRSGDLGRYNHDGTVELIGRKDSMLKLDGARVEAGQVEYVIRRNLSDGDAAIVDVLGAVDGVSDPILAAYIYLGCNPMNLEHGPVEDMQFRAVTDRHAVHALTESLGEAIRQSLPMYYIPSLYLLVDRVPRTKSKKTDRRKLHMLGQEYYMANREALKGVIVWPDWESAD
ncbi:uncharacterized protein PFLUO_LOCUS94 [Penicillium psychrofluorescens]|uniref:uncharacterized protein n=1 Tax=Penicillium psychrofluorescens TaxID=3158075 RepID=UPI003CCDC818